MKTLSEYLVASFTASLIVGIGERMTPAGMKKYVTFTASLMLLIFLFTPIRSLGEELFRFAENAFENERQELPSTDGYDEVIKLTRKKAEESIQKHLLETFDLQNDISVSLTMDIQEDGTILITHISLKLSKNDMQIAEEIERYLEKIFQTETNVSLS